MSLDTIFLLQFTCPCAIPKIIKVRTLLNVSPVQCCQPDENIADGIKAACKYFIKISFTLYPAHSRVGIGNLVLRRSVTHLLPNSGGIACRVAELNAALYLDTKAKKWKYKFK